MSNSINTNIAAYYAQENITTASNAASENVARLSSGNAIVEASDNVSALAIGTSLGSQVNALTAAQTNAAQGSSLLQVADGALAQIQSILQQQQSLALQAESGSLTDTDRGFLNQQFSQLTSEIDALATGTTFNGVTLINGTLSSSSALRDATNGSTSAGAAGVIAGSATSTSDGAETFEGAGGTIPTFTNDAATSNDTTFYGDLSNGTFNVTATSNHALSYTVSYTLNGSTYQGIYANTTSTTSLSLDNGSATIKFTIAGALGHASQTTANVDASLGQVFANATGFASHKILSVDATDSSGNNIAGTAIQAADNLGQVISNGTSTGFSGTDVTLQASSYSSTDIPSIAGFTSSGAGVGSTLSVDINGAIYTTAAMTVTGALSTSKWNGGSGVAVFYLDGNVNNTNTELTINFATDSATGLTNTSGDLNAITAALDKAFSNSGSATGGLTFQLGATSAANVTVTLGDASSSSLFGGSALNISTSGGASAAATAVTTALNTVTAQRATTGAYESQFNFASAALQSSVQNESAAQSQLLDTNIATESTLYATNQVKLQAGISVLAQANQQAQALLKLIG